MNVAVLDDQQTIILHGGEQNGRFIRTNMQRTGNTFYRTCPSLHVPLMNMLQGILLQHRPMPCES